jgi:hypothetical protein
MKKFLGLLLVVTIHNCAVAQNWITISSEATIDCHDQTFDLEIEAESRWTTLCHIECIVAMSYSAIIQKRINGGSWQNVNAATLSQAPLPNTTYQHLVTMSGLPVEAGAEYRAKLTRTGHIDSYVDGGCVSVLPACWGDFPATELVATSDIFTVEWDSPTQLSPTFPNFGNWMNQANVYEICESGDITLSNLTPEGCMLSWAIEVYESSSPFAQCTISNGSGAIPDEIIIPASSICNTTQNGLEWGQSGNSVNIKITWIGSDSDYNIYSGNWEKTFLRNTSPTSSISVGQPDYYSCEGSAVTMTASGPGTLTWLNGSTVENTGTSYSVSNLTQTTTYTVESDQYCTSPATTTLHYAPIPTIDLTPIPSVICASETPLVFQPTVNPTGGTGTWSGMSSCVMNGNSFDPEGNGCNVSGWSYSYGFTSATYTYDLNGCEASESKSITYHKSSPLNLSVTATCSNTEEGSVSISPSGNGPFTNLAWTLPSGTTSPSYGTNSVSQLNSGFGSVTVDDDDGCALIEDFEIEELDAPELDNILAQDITDPICHSAQTPYNQGGTGSTIWGTVDLAWTNGDPNYSILMDGNVVASNITGNSYSMTSLVTGSYDFEIMDDNGCLSDVEGATLFPDVWMNPSIVTSAATCLGIDNGEIQLNITNDNTQTAALSFTYDWSNNSTVNPVTNLSANAELDVTVTTSQGCLLNLFDLEVGSASSPISASISAVSPTCNGVNDGSLTATQTGATSPIYAWSNNVNGALNDDLVDGTYTVTVTETSGTYNGCYDIEQHTLLPAGGDKWQQFTGDQTTASDKIIAMETDDDDNVYVLGQFEDQTKIGLNTVTVGAGATGTGAFIAKYDQCGNLIWTKWTTKNVNNTYDIEPIDIVLNGNEIIVLLATEAAANELLEINGSSGSILLDGDDWVTYSLLTSNGTVACSTKISNGLGSNDVVNDMKINGNTLFLAGKNSSTGEATVFDIDISTCVTTNTANMFVKDLNTNSPNSEFTDIAFGSGNTMYAIGTAHTEFNFTSGTSLIPNGSSDAFVARYYNTNNTPVCSTQVMTGDGIAASGVALTIDDNGDIVIGGNHSENMQNFGNLSTGMNNGFVGRLDGTTLAVDWMHNMDEPSNEISSAECTGVDLDNDNNVIASGNFNGQTARFTTSGSSISAYGTNNQENAWLARFDNGNSGGILSVWSIDGNTEDATSTALSCGEMNCYVGGIYNSDISFYPTSEADLSHAANTNTEAAYIVRFGNIYEELGQFYKDGDQNSIISETSFQLYPNPTNDMATITWEVESDMDTDLQIRVLDVHGRIVSSQTAPQAAGMLNLNLNRNPSGMYFVEIETERDLWREKLIKH